jgi:hypothetical protein
VAEGNSARIFSSGSTGLTINLPSLKNRKEDIPCSPGIS